MLPKSLIGGFLLAVGSFFGFFLVFLIFFRQEQISVVVIPYILLSYTLQLLSCFGYFLLAFDMAFFLQISQLILNNLQFRLLKRCLNLFCLLGDVVIVEAYVWPISQTQILSHLSRQISGS